MHYLTMVLRLVHILGGVFWVGSNLVMGFFISPTIAATADAGKKFMGYLVNQARITTAITVAAVLTVLAGGWLYWIDSNGFTSAWTKSGAGVVFGIGGVLGLIGFIFGMLLGKNINILAKVGSEVQGKPTPEQMNQLQAAQKQLGIVGPISMIALILAIACMSIARYWF